MLNFQSSSETMNKTKLFVVIFKSARVMV